MTGLPLPVRNLDLAWSSLRSETSSVAEKNLAPNVRHGKTRSASAVRYPDRRVRDSARLETVS